MLTCLLLLKTNSQQNRKLLFPDLGNGFVLLDKLQFYDYNYS